MSKRRSPHGSLPGPAAKIIAIAPISLGGLGVREASMAALLGRSERIRPRLWRSGWFGSLCSMSAGLSGFWCTLQRPAEG